MNKTKKKQNIEISKELLCEVLGKKVSIWSEDSIIDSVIEIGIHLPSGGRLYKQLNIYEFVFKCKEWAYQNNYDMWSITWGAIEFSNNIKYKGTKRIDADTEIEAIIKACEWILESSECDIF